MKKNKALVLELNIDNNGYVFPNTISDAFVDANNELFDLGIKLSETLEAIKVLTPECDKYDYILSASSGALCGLIEIFFVGKPGESPLGDITDKWFADRTIDMKEIVHRYQQQLNFLKKSLKFLMTKVLEVEYSVR